LSHAGIPTEVVPKLGKFLEQAIILPVTEVQQSRRA